MCGVCGMASFRDGFDSAAASGHVNAMVEALAHRGPDESGLLNVSSAVLGATRLAIRGLHSGKQPIVDRDSGVMIVCNGEIDNHHELRRWLETRGRKVELATDIAVIPGLYLELGDAFVERMAGVFAVAVWDPRKQRIILARDRAGERPLFFALKDGVVRFATEIAALAFRCRAAADLRSSGVARVSAIWLFCRADHTVQRNPESLPGGSRDHRRSGRVAPALLALERRVHAQTQPVA